MATDNGWDDQEEEAGEGLSFEPPPPWRPSPTTADLKQQIADLVEEAFGTLRADLAEFTQRVTAARDALERSAAKPAPRLREDG